MITANLYHGPLELYKQTTIIPMMARLGLVAQGIDDGPPLKARVNHGRWIVDCECNGAEFAWDEGFFMCQSCFNVGHGLKYRKSVFPKSRQKIELLLIGRPIVNRNWFPGESLAQLRAENIKGGPV